MTVVEFEGWVQWYAGVEANVPAWKQWRELPHEEKISIRKIVDSMYEDKQCSLPTT